MGLLMFPALPAERTKVRNLIIIMRMSSLKRDRKRMVLRKKL